MARVRVREEIAAPAGAVWAAVGDLERAGDWPAVETCKLEGSGVGCVRTLHLVDGAVIHERVEAHDDEARSYRAEVFTLGHMPVKDYRYTVSISEAGPDRCVIDWLATFEPAGVSEERACHMIEGLYTASTSTIREELETR